MTFSRKIIATLCLLSASAVGGILPAFAEANITNVVDQAKYTMLPYGIRSGSIIFSPGIGVDEMYDDNVYDTESNTRSDFITTVKPSFGVTTDFDLHSLIFRMGSSLGYYNDF